MYSVYKLQQQFYDTLVKPSEKTNGLIYKKKTRATVTYETREYIILE